MSFLKLTLLQKCSRKQTIHILIFVAIFLTFHVWITRIPFSLVNNIGTVLPLRRYPAPGVKYILLQQKYYLELIIERRKEITISNCPVNNCVFTSNDKFFHDVRYFDAVMFETEIQNKKYIPPMRSNSQLYIFSTLESSYNNPACELYNEDFFNWTFTYRLDSDIPWTYFIVRNFNGSIVAPKVDVVWNTSSDSISPYVKSKLQSKKKAAAWIVSHCKTDSFRDEYLSKLQDHLFHYYLKIDVFGKCSKNKCFGNDCGQMIRNDYYFYMAFENSFSNDYVTEKVLHGYDNYAVPVVYGGANYSRFLPPGSYISARGMHPYNLAYTIYQAVKSPEIYEKYFRWTNLYTIDSDPKVNNPLCDLCEALNSDNAKHAPPRKKFRLWWNGRNGMKWCLPDSYWNETANVNIDASHIFTLY